jgi:hypothetical protein
MANRPISSESAILEQARVALTNAQNQPVIANLIAEMGYDSEKLNEGQTVLSETEQAYDLNRKEDDESSAAYDAYASSKEDLDDHYRLLRKKAKVIFRDDPATMELLAVDGSIPAAHTRYMEMVSKFFKEVIPNEVLQQKLAVLKVTPEVLATGQSLIDEVKSNRATYLLEKGESQDATKLKDEAFAKLDDWMSEFYAVARIALDDRPQLLEALSKTVIS